MRNVRHQTDTVRLPIIYSPRYDIRVLGIEKLHPFDSEKYGKVYRYLVEKVGIDEGAFYRPDPVSEETLLTVHSAEYLKTLNKSINIALIAEVMMAAIVPNPILQKHLLLPKKYATGGTMLGCELAFKHGWAINLSGGYHHAKADSGGGFCYFADVPISVKKLWNEKSDLKVMIVDLDAHQGNGNAEIFWDDPRVTIFDVFNGYIYPGDYEAARFVTYNHPVKMFIGDGEYLGLLKRELPSAIEESNPDLIVYNAGTDVLKGDMLGGMCITAEGIINRDGFVFSQAIKRDIPILMLLSGGYTRRSAKIIGKSIENILINVLGIKT
jgi:histone deacetylase 11